MNTPSRQRHLWMKMLGGVKVHPLVAALALLATILAILPHLQTRPALHATATDTAIGTTASGGKTGATPPVSRSVPQGSPTATQPPPQRQPRAHRSITSRASVASERPLWPKAAETAAQEFLATYLRFTYAQLPATKIQAASPDLHARIAASPPHVPAAIHRLHPRIAALDIIPAPIINAGMGWAATATVTDGQQIYRMTIKLSQRHGRWLVTAMLGQ